MVSRSDWPTALGSIHCACGNTPAARPTASRATWSGADKKSLCNVSSTTTASVGGAARATFYDGHTAPTCEATRDQRPCTHQCCGDRWEAAGPDRHRPPRLAATLEIEGHVYESGLLTLSFFGDEPFCGVVHRDA